MDLNELKIKFTKEYLDFILHKREKSFSGSGVNEDLYSFEIKDTLLKELFHHMPNRFSFNGYKFIKTVMYNAHNPTYRNVNTLWMVAKETKESENTKQTFTNSINPSTTIHPPNKFQIKSSLINSSVYK